MPFYFLFLVLSMASAATITPSTFCNLIQNGTCIRNQTLNNTGSITAPSDKSILINNTFLICNNSITCVITIMTNATITINNSTILAPYINISSLTTILVINSEISTNGTIGLNLGSSLRVDQGNAFLGLGAFCGVTSFSDLTYGKICETLSGNTSMHFSGSGGNNSNTYGSINIKSSLFIYFYFRRGVSQYNRVEYFHAEFEIEC